MATDIHRTLTWISLEPFAEKARAKFTGRVFLLLALHPAVRSRLMLTHIY